MNRKSKRSGKDKRNNDIGYDVYGLSGKAYESKGPVVVVITLLSQRSGGAVTEGKRPPIIPGFVLGFLVLAGLNSFDLIPPVLGAFLAKLSSWALLAAIAAVGMKTDLRNIIKVGGGAIALIVAETLFLAALALTGLRFIELAQ